MNYGGSKRSEEACNKTQETYSLFVQKGTVSVPIGINRLSGNRITILVPTFYSTVSMTSNTMLNTSTGIGTKNGET